MTRGDSKGSSVLPFPPVCKEMLVTNESLFFLKSEVKYIYFTEDPPLEFLGMLLLE